MYHGGTSSQNTLSFWTLLFLFYVRNSIKFHFCTSFITVQCSLIGGWQSSTFQVAKVSKITLIHVGSDVLLVVILASSLKLGSIHMLNCIVFLSRTAGTARCFNLSGSIGVGDD